MLCWLRNLALYLWVLGILWLSIDAMAHWIVMR